MKVGLFGYDRDRFTEAARRGLRAFPHVKIEQQIPNCWSPMQALRDLEAVVILGNRGKNNAAADYYSAREVPVFMVDQPHLVRGIDPPQYRVSPVDHAWLPARAAPDRLAALEASGAVSILDSPKRTKGQGILLCGQRERDPTHGMSRSTFKAWAESAVKKCKSLDRSEVVWRPHPLDVYQIAGADAYSDPREESLADAMAGCWLVVVYSSTCGLDALLAGKPVLADGPAVYSELAGSFSDWKSLATPDPAKLRTLLERIAYTQWTVDEIATGESFRSFLEPPPEPEEVPEPDDFSSIPGIGPKAAAAIVEGGISTFGELCDVDQDQIDALELSKPAAKALAAYRGETSEQGGGE